MILQKEAETTIGGTGDQQRRFKTKWKRKLHLYLRFGKELKMVGHKG